MKYGYADMNEWVHKPSPTGNPMTCLNEMSLQTSDLGLHLKSNPFCDSSPKESTGGLGTLEGEKSLDLKNPSHPTLRQTCTAGPSLCFGHVSLPAENSWLSVGFWLWERSFLRCRIRTTEKLLGYIISNKSCSWIKSPCSFKTNCPETEIFLGLVPHTTEIATKFNWPMLSV